ncbi:MAG: hypothetical protein HYW00_00060 [Candidatus Colwellbacteria bacterium]|nr:hypothetical protein [Candidatus Colwellbacteria bacterium]
MEKEIKKFIESAKGIILSSEEKQKMRENLLLFIEKHPVREKFDTRPQLQKRSGLFQLKLRPMPVFAVITAIVLVGGGGTSLAAESALPGDFLYTVKVNVNEEVRGKLAVSDEAKARVEASLAERRLEEAAELAAKGRLTAKAQTEIESRFKAHVDKFENRADKLAAKGKADTAAEISSNLAASLKAHVQILDSFEAESGEDKKGGTEVRVKPQPLITAIRIGLGAVEKTRVDAETQVSAGAKADVEAAAQGKLKAATNKIAEVRALIERTKGSVSASTTALAEARLNLAEEAIVEGKAKLEADAFAEAFMSFDQAHRLAQEVQLVINGAQKFKIDIRNDDQKYWGCPMPMPAMPNWICPDGTTAGPSCVDGHWIIKQCPAAVETSTQSETNVQGEGKSWLRLGF